MHQDKYRDGYEVGKRDKDGEEIERLAQQNGEGGGKLSPEQLSDWYLGYYHGRGHARTGEPSKGAQKRNEAN